MQICAFLLVLFAVFARIQAQNNSTSGSISFGLRKAVTDDGFLVAASPFNLRFREVLSNEGFGWNSATDEFTAPEAGGYFFTFNAMSTKKSDFTMALMKNGKYLVTAYAEKGYNMAGNSALLSLQAGDSVVLNVQDGAIYENPLYEAYTTFSGFQVFRN